MERNASDSAMRTPKPRQDRRNPAIVIALVFVLMFGAYATRAMSAGNQGSEKSPQVEQGASPEMFVPSGSAGLNHLTYSADGSLLGAGSFDNTVKIFDVRSNLEVRKFSGHVASITGVAILSNDDTVISGSEDGTIRFWSLEKGDAVRTVRVGGRVAGLAVSGDGHLLVVASEHSGSVGNSNSELLLWSVLRGEWLPALTSQQAKIQAVTISQDGKVIASGDEQHTIKLWNAESGAQILAINTDKGTVQSLAFNRNATMLAGGIAFNPQTSMMLTDNPPAQPQPHDGEARVWELPSGKLSRTFHLMTLDELVVALAPDGTQLATASRIRGPFAAGEGRGGNRVHLWNVQNGKEGRLDYIDLADSVAFNPDGRTLAVATRLAVKTLNAATGRVMSGIGGFTWATRHLDYIRDDRLIIDVGQRKNIIDLTKDDLIDRSPCHESRYFGDGAYNPGERREPTACSPDERTLARAVFTEPIVEIVDADSGKSSRRIPVKADDLNFIGDGHTLAIWTEGYLELRDVASGELRSRFAVIESRSNWSWRFSPQGNYLLTNRFSESDKTNDLHVYDTRAGREIYAKKNFSAFGVECFYSPDDQAFAVITATKVNVYEMKTGNELFALPGQLGAFGAVTFSQDRKVIVESGSRLQLWNGETGAEIGTLNGHVGRINTAKFSPDGKFLATAGEDRTVKFWDVESKTLQKTLVGHTAGVEDFVFSPDGKRIATGSADARIILWRIADGTPLVTFVRTNEGELISITPDNYYHASPSALSAIALRVGRKVVPLSQFDLKLNRPDIILERLGSTDSQLINLYRSAYERRLRKMGFNKNQLGADLVLPEVAITPANVLATTQDPKLSLRIHASDARHQLASINVLINGVPVFGRRGIDLTAKATRDHEEALTLELTRGRNRIEIYATNELGVESLYDTIEIEYTAARSVKPDLYIAVIGVSTYKTDEYNLHYAAKDARDLADALEIGNREAFNQIHVYPFLDGDAQREKILRLKELLSSSKVDDEIVVFVSGHGLLDEKSEYYFGTNDIDFSKPQERGLSYDELEDIIDGVPARKKLLLLDTCHAGALDRDNAFFENAKPEQESSAPENKDPVVKYVPRDVHVKMVRLDHTAELLEGVFADLRRRTGTVVIGAAGASEYAFESEHWRNGVFTFSILSGLRNGAADLNRDGDTTIAELQEFVGGEVARLTRGAQKPVARQVRDAFDFPLFHNAQLLRALPHSGSGVYAVAWSPDGNRIATTADDGAIRIWKSSTGELERLIRSTANASNVLKWTADGNMVLADVWKDINFYDVTNGEIRRAVKTDNTYLSDFVLTADEQSVFANGDARAVTKYQTSDGHLIRTFDKHSSQVRNLALSRDDRFIASGEDNGAIYIWDLTRDQLIHSIAGAHVRNVTVLHFFRSGAEPRLVSAGAEGTLRFWDPNSGAALQTIKTDQGPKDHVTCLTFSRDEQRFATGHADGAIRVWRTSDRNLITTILAHRGPIRGLSFSLDGQVLASTGGDGMARLWRLN